MSIDKREVEETVLDLLITLLRRFTKCILDEVADEVLRYTRIEIWLRRNIEKREVSKIAEDILKSSKLMEKFNKEYRACIEAGKDKEFCKGYAITSIVREYLRKNLHSKILNLSKKYLRESLHL
ncbi:MAG: hypothetical protein DRN91_08780 [Candidatus Alkanophagales archaeon]|nr:MAG: hypothetical protein DRN91_08780 [Candidatus Alkanophagales archaeon]